MKFNRRDFIKVSGATAPGKAVSCLPWVDKSLSYDRTRHVFIFFGIRGILLSVYYLMSQGGLA